MPSGRMPSSGRSARSTTRSPDEEMSAKIYRIEEITGKILDYQKKHPNRQGQLRPSSNYYLPMTLR